MGAPELIALSLGLSILVAAAALVGGRAVESLSADPRLRDLIWAGALNLPALPPLTVGALLLRQAPIRDLPTVKAGMSAALPATPVESAVTSAPAVLSIDPTVAAWAVLAIAVLLTVGRMTGLALRVRRLLRVIAGAEAASPRVREVVAETARDFAIRPPRVGISAATSEPLLASLGQARLILPLSLAGRQADLTVTRAMVAHELAHLKRGDHHILWIEEILLALLAINPLMPVLRARRAAAREEACDAMALRGASPEARRAYARSLIEALRSRAAPRASGGLPALTFTGAGKTTAMSRLKAVMDPSPGAGLGLRLLAMGLGSLVAALAAAGSLAVAAEREAVIRVPGASATAPTLVAGFRISTGGESLPAGQPQGALVADRPDPVQSPEETGSSLSPEQRARYRNPTGARYRALCASSDPADGGFCAGVIFSQFPLRGGSGGGVCLPAELNQEDESIRRAALGMVVDRTKAEIARASILESDHPADVARTALARAYPCEA